MPPTQTFGGERSGARPVRALDTGRQIEEVVDVSARRQFLDHVTREVDHFARVLHVDHRRGAGDDDGFRELPDCSARRSRAGCCQWSPSIPLRSCFVNPSRENVTLYVPTGKLVRRYWPLEPVTVVEFSR